jgi:hypothetical protein
LRTTFSLYARVHRSGLLQIGDVFDFHPANIRYLMLFVKVPIQKK